MFERLLLGYAGDEAGRDGAVLAGELAHLCGAELSVAFPYHPLLASIPAEVAEQRIRDELQALTDDERLSRSSRVHWSNSSWPIRALHELAAFEGAGLIVLGAAPAHLEHRHLDLMERMVHGAPCAVAVAPAGYAERPRRELRRIGVGFADTPEGCAALVLGGELALLAGGEQRIVAGCGLSPGLASYAARSTSALGPAEDRLQHETEAALERALSELEPPAVEPIVRDVRRGDPRHALLEASEQLDLLILGSRDYGPLRHVLLGSVSADAMRAARCPVLVLSRHVSASAILTSAEHSTAAER